MSRARTPFAKTSLYPLPDSVTGEATVTLADIMPTSSEVGVLNWRVKPGEWLDELSPSGGPAGVASPEIWRPRHDRRLKQTPSAQA